VKTEIVLLVTPRVVRNIARPHASDLEFASGTEAAIGAAPLRLSGAAGAGVAIAPSQSAGTPSVGPLAPAGPEAAVPGPRGKFPLGTASPPPADLIATAKPPAPPADLGAQRIALTAPPQASLGSAFGVTVGMPAGVSAASAELELGYDPRLLQVIGVGGGGADPVTIVPTEPGRLLLRTKASVPGGAQPITVQFRVVASAAAATQVTLSNVQAADAQGRPLALTPPPVHVLRVGP
jgi:general secretion pathway protein D